MSRSRPRVRASWLGSVPYQQAWDLQAELVRELRQGRGEDTLLLLEHPHVFTMGKAASADDLLWDEAERARRGVEVVWSDRGFQSARGRRPNGHYSPGLVACLIHHRGGFIAY